MASTGTPAAAAQLATARPKSQQRLDAHDSADRIRNVLSREGMLFDGRLNT
jgi:hypothetical protein